MAQLPQEFLTRMQEMLGDEFDAFLTSYDAPRTAGLRVNTKKCRTEDFPPLVPGTWKKIPWIPNGYFVPDGMRMGQSPLYAAGVFYLQEPSAMTPASRLPIEPGERVLDLCAAPGGKATELNARLKGTGLLVANDISNARAKALLRNLELFGSENVLVTNETPAGLADVFPGFFDKILVDAPCSGEGMFRKDEAVIGTWTPERPDFFAELQREITSNAVKMLRPGGLMMYSTCTFAPQELLSLYERNNETETFVEEYPLKKEEEPEIDLSDLSSASEVPLLLQWDQRWGYHRYAGEVMGLSGCGPTALSMVAIFMTGDITKNPRWVADFASQNGYAVDGSGTAWSLMLEGARQIGLSSKEIPVERERVENNLQAGNPIIALMGPGEFTSNGHFIVLTGLQNGRLKINDPNSRKNSEKTWDIDQVLEQTKAVWVYYK